MRIKVDHKPEVASVGSLIAANDRAPWDGSSSWNPDQLPETGLGIVMEVEEVEIDEDYIETLYRVHTINGIEEWWANEIWILPDTLAS